MTIPIQAPIMSFNDAYDAATSGGRQCNLLLGNGFSVAGAPQYFKYNPADMPQPLHSILRGRYVDIQSVGLEGMASSRAPSSWDTMKEQILGMMIRKHPSSSDDIGGAGHYSCWQFLDRFIGSGTGSRANSNRSAVYVLNYDLMLYWNFMRSLEENVPYTLDFDDGFRRYQGNKNMPLVWWQPSTQNIFFMHGAFHLSNTQIAGNEYLSKLEYNEDQSLRDQFMGAFSARKLPFVVFEDKHTVKLDAIWQAPYLRSCYERFLRTVNDPGASLLVYGCSFHRSDNHIWQAILTGQCQVYISIYDTPDSNHQSPYLKCPYCSLATRADAFHSLSSENVRKIWLAKDPRFHFFCARSAHVWDKTLQQILKDRSAAKQHKEPSIEDLPI